MRNYYDCNAIKYYNATVDIDMGEIYQEFLALLSLYSHIMDLGCGSGRDTRYFLIQGYQVTAIDSSKEMVKLSSRLTGQSTLLMTFDQLNFTNCFDGVWACASLLHISRTQIPFILSLIINALKSNGILYLSFKYGTQERVEEDPEAVRLFCDYNESLLADLLKDLDIIKIWLTQDQTRPVQWINALARKP